MNQPKDKLFESNFDKPKFRIEIEVCESASTIEIKSIDGYKATYIEVLGALQSQMHNMMCSQREHNQKQAKKQKITK